MAASTSTTACLTWMRSNVHRVRRGVLARVEQHKGATAAQPSESAALRRRGKAARPVRQSA
jgi:hypothetical protein